MTAKQIETRGKILIVADEALIANDLEGRLDGLGDTVCGQATSAGQALGLVDLMDYCLSGECSWIIISRPGPMAV